MTQTLERYARDMQTRVEEMLPEVRGGQPQSPVLLDVCCSFKAALLSTTGLYACACAYSR